MDRRDEQVADTHRHGIVSGYASHHDLRNRKHESSFNLLQVFISMHLK